MSEPNVTTFDEFVEILNKDPEYRKASEKIAPVYDLITGLTALRKQVDDLMKLVLEIEEGWKPKVDDD